MQHKLLHVNFLILLLSYLKKKNFSKEEYRSTKTIYCIFSTSRCNLCCISIKLADPIPSSLRPARPPIPPRPKGVWDTSGVAWIQHRMVFYYTNLKYHLFIKYRNINGFFLVFFCLLTDNIALAYILGNKWKWISFTKIKYTDIYSVPSTLYVTSCNNHSTVPHALWSASLPNLRISNRK